MEIGYSIRTNGDDIFYVKDLNTANELIFRILFKSDIVLDDYLEDLRKAIKLGENSASANPQDYESYIMDILNDESRLEGYDICIEEIQFTAFEQIEKYFPI